MSYSSFHSISLHLRAWPLEVSLHLLPRLLVYSSARSPCQVSLPSSPLSICYSAWLNIQFLNSHLETHACSSTWVPVKFFHTNNYLPEKYHAVSCVLTSIYARKFGSYWENLGYHKLLLPFILRPHPKAILNFPELKASNYLVKAFLVEYKIIKCPSRLKVDYFKVWNK